jgi:hypothetical protein
MHPLSPACSSESPVAHAGETPAERPTLDPIRKCASRRLTSQPDNGAPRRLSDQFLEGASRRSNIQQFVKTVATAMPVDTAEVHQQSCRAPICSKSIAKGRSRQSKSGRCQAASKSCLSCFRSVARHQRCLTTPLKWTPNSAAHWPSSAGASPHFALAIQRSAPLGAT